MATYAELLSLVSSESLFNKVRVACWVAADTIRAEDAGTANHTARVAWARGVFDNPDGTARSMVCAVLAQNRTFTVAEINAAADEDVQLAVNAAVNVFAI